MQDITELERRITAAMDRIAAGVERRASAGQGAEAEIARLTEALDEERMTSAQLNERVRVLREREAQLEAQIGTQSAVQTGPIAADEFAADDRAADPAADLLQADLAAAQAQLTEAQAQLAAQNDEIATLRRVLAEAGKEIAALRAARAQEAAELDDIIAALDPLLTPAPSEAPHA